jgi:hypothetical protein
MQCASWASDAVSYLEGERLLPEPQVLCRHKTRQEDVDAFPHTAAGASHPISHHLRHCQQQAYGNKPADSRDDRQIVCAVCVLSAGRYIISPEGHGDHAVGARLAVQAADIVGQVVQHAEVVLHHDNVLFVAQQAPYHLRRQETFTTAGVWCPNAAPSCYVLPLGLAKDMASSLLQHSAWQCCICNQAQQR